MMKHHKDIMNALLVRFLLLEKTSVEIGFAWPNAKAIIEQISSECLEVSEALESQSRDELFSEVGDLLHAVMCLCEYLDMDISDVLQHSLNKYESRLEAVKAVMMEEGHNSLHHLSHIDKMLIWQKAKILGCHK
jgi:ATP diphosphatase